MDKSYYIFSSGTLKRKDNTLCLIKSSGEKAYIPIENVYDLYVFSDININSDFLDFLGSQAICLHCFNYHGYYSGTFYPREKQVSGDLIVNQVKHYIDKEKREHLAKKFVTGGAENILRNLKYYQNRGRDLIQEIEDITCLKEDIKKYNGVCEIMGLEGNIRKIYYSGWTKIINREIDFDKRVKRPPDNMINTMISFLNSVFYTKTISEIYRTQLHPSISYLHEPSTKRFSLALDVSEVFKPLIVDRLIFRLLNKNIVTENDFVKEEGFLRFKPSKVKEIIKYLDDYMMETIMHRSLRRNVSYRHLVRLELYKLIKHLIGDKEYSSFKIWW
ncbi:MAG: type I-B CRISPR-associated endonuclease Cas1b [Christensenellales bacterium]|jgi:CRISPR-associated protein Cas1